MSSRALVAATAAALLASAPGALYAQESQAEALNNAGKALFKEKRYLDAYRKFAAAAELQPEGRFYFNVCFTLNYLERYSEAIDACERVAPSGADAELLEKTETVLKALREKVGSTDSEPSSDAGGAPPPGAGDGATEPPVGPEAAVADDPFVLAEDPAGGYEWAVGGELTGFGNLGIGRTDGRETYESGGGGIRAFANFLLLKDRGVGAQAFIGFNDLAASSDSFSDERLFWLDIGGGVFLHRSLTDSITWAPQVGAQLAFQKPDTSSEQVLIALGLRADVTVAYTFGSSQEHAITAAPALTLYTGSVGGAGEIDAASYGLDGPSATLGLSVGYQYRFSTPFAAIPLITLE